MNVARGHVPAAVSVAEQALDRIIGRTAMRMIELIPWLSIYLSAFTVLAYLIRHNTYADEAGRLDAVFTGMLGGVAIWFLIALVSNEAALPSPKTDQSMRDLSARAAENKRLLRKPRHPQALPAAVADLNARLDTLERSVKDSATEVHLLESPGTVCVMLWRDLHDIEESMIEVATDDELDGILRHIEDRVQGSKLDKRDSPVRQKVDVARGKIDSRSYDIRPLLRDIQAQVNDFRDEQYQTLVDGRARIDHYSGLAGIAAWALLGLAIIQGAPDWAIASVSAFYLVGAISGLLTVLNGNTLTRSPQDIFGYGRAHIRESVLLSGLAAVGAVAVTWIISQSAGGVTQQDLQSAFAPKPAAFLVAAAFGIAPGPLLEKLHGYAQTSLQDLESTAPKGTSGATA